MSTEVRSELASIERQLREYDRLISQEEDGQYMDSADLIAHYEARIAELRDRRAELEQMEPDTQEQVNAANMQLNRYFRQHRGTRIGKMDKSFYNRTYHGAGANLVKHVYNGCLSHFRWMRFHSLAERMFEDTYLAYYYLTYNLWFEQVAVDAAWQTFVSECQS